MHRPCSWLRSRAGSGTCRTPCGDWIPRRGSGRCWQSSLAGRFLESWAARSCSQSTGRRAATWRGTPRSSTGTHCAEPRRGGGCGHRTGRHHDCCGSNRCQIHVRCARNGRPTRFIAVLQVERRRWPKLGAIRTRVRMPHESGEDQGRRPDAARGPTTPRGTRGRGSGSGRRRSRAWRRSGRCRRRVSGGRAGPARR